MNIKKIVIVGLVILVLGAGGILYLRNYYQNKDKVVSDAENFMKDGQDLSQEWAVGVVSGMLKKGSVIYDFKFDHRFLGSIDEQIEQGSGTAYFRGPNMIKININTLIRGETVEKEWILNKGIVYSKSSGSKDGKFVKIPITENAGKNSYSMFSDYNFYQLMIDINKEISSLNPYNVKDTGNESIDGEDLKVVKYSTTTIFAGEEKNIKLWISEESSAIKKAEIETRIIPVVAEQENGSIEKNIIEIKSVRFEKISLSDFIVSAENARDYKSLGEEIVGLFKDSDDDGVIDSVEKELFKTDPNNPDTDGDGFKDGDELDSGYDPRKAGGEKLFNI